MSVESKILLSEKVSNKLRKFGSNTEYFPCYVETEEGTVPALFTQSQIQEAVERAQVNPEDVPEEDKNLCEEVVDFVKEIFS